MEHSFSALLMPMVQYHIQARTRIIANITDADLVKRIIPEVSSVGFLLTHLAETSYFFATQLFEGPTEYLPKYGAKAKDQGDLYSLGHIDEFHTKAISIVLHSCETYTNEEWLQKVPLLPFAQEMQRSVGLQTILMHAQHHLGQISQALRHAH
jgi:uncharacterized damage-inducible protein DinB